MQENEVLNATIRLDLLGLCWVTLVIVNFEQYQFHGNGELFIMTLAVVLSTEAEVS